MQRTFEPQTRILGNKPIGWHLTEQVVEKIVNGKRRKVKTMVKFPVYRGISASTLRYLKSNAKYQHKLAMWRRAEAMAAKEATKESTDEQPDEPHGGG
jgi:hypothetical protein